MKNLAHSASLDSEDKDAPSKSGIKHLYLLLIRTTIRREIHGNPFGSGCLLMFPSFTLMLVVGGAAVLRRFSRDAGAVRLHAK
ncbi:MULTISPECIES: hypothetical protein [unclassified Mesorhizobium]|nr:MULTISPECIES: hypothetical protein [unclassified Mesorhizobium]RUU68173.1 hypothetical protein EOC99_00305 [Mesorhizobium sp. M7A.T.Ca.TU.009.01.1.1]RUX07711.1 hypothetical protein EOA35_02150 [Mesorhizobium sp. M8A.F.Ca.ET.023.01.1.1]TGQ76343.1 hypothetical protein EN850_33185 [Mesorhizobium sp. M8A.F.Ca.ET.207.01.1.1]TGR16469.1 hypothetical protein EN845_33635 [Mesorhizobium sp. M8A.F.Ca.ET.202.01.1.1]TGR17566.1 hypothetical protein EN840_33850 [Mesorhizobium sp. M8A.F.Ca.ET.197.01.1.1]T